MWDEEEGGAVRVHHSKNAAHKPPKTLPAGR